MATIISTCMIMFMDRTTVSIWPIRVVFCTTPWMPSIRMKEAACFRVFSTLESLKATRWALAE